MEKIVGHAFISYVREDAHQVDQLQQILETAGISVWRDTADLWPGEDWRRKIRRAITDNALVFIACFSSQSTARTKSYQYEELMLAIDQLRLRPPDVPWLIPVRFDNCAVPDLDIGGGRTMASIQHADLFGDHRDTGVMRLLAIVRQILGQRSVEYSVIPAFVLITGRGDSAGHIIQILTDKYWGFVREAAAVYGEVDVIARIEASSVQVIHEFASGMLKNLPDGYGTKTYIVVPQLFVERPVRQSTAPISTISAFLFIEAIDNNADALFRKLMGEYHEFVTEAAAVYGGTDIIARVEASSVAKLHDFVMGELQTQECVRAVRTYIIIPQLHKVWTALRDEV